MYSGQSGSAVSSMHTLPQDMTAWGSIVGQPTSGQPDKWSAAKVKHMGLTACNQLMSTALSCSRPMQGKMHIRVIQVLECFSSDLRGARVQVGAKAVQSSSKSTKERLSSG